MFARFRTLLEHLHAGLVPVDGDGGRRREAAADPDDPAPVERDRPGPPSWKQEEEWIPSAILYGPPV